jgi:anaerobic ribonucleoside-triphosphate reductase activating protein
MKVRIAGVTKESVVDGPGIRFVIYAQGCPHRCAGCHNPQTHSLEGGVGTELAELSKVISQTKLIRGVTFSGGEPFLQSQEFARLAETLKYKGYDLVTYSGFQFEEIMQMAVANKHIKELLQLTDILIDGPYIASKIDLKLAFRGSQNQRLIDVPQSLIAGKPIEWEDSSQKIFI